MSSMTIKSVQSVNPFKSVIQTSLAYDIVNAHGGEIIDDTKEGDGTEFKIKLSST
jgi:signal transduction histidine kinase